MRFYLSKADEAGRSSRILKNFLVFLAATCKASRQKKIKFFRFEDQGLFSKVKSKKLSLLGYL
jgi:hypothetical protein